MMDAATDRGFRIAMYAVVAVAVAAFVIFVYGYPRFFPYILEADPENFRENVAKALAKGDLPGAIRIAEIATRRSRLNPETYVLHAELLLRTGSTAGALQQLEKAVALTTTPAPEYRLTHLPHYHPRARLMLGSICWREGDAAGAVVHFELARPLVDVHDNEFAMYHSAMHEAYAALGAWSRALEFGAPSPQRLRQLELPSLVSLMRAAEGMQQWDLLAQAGRALLTQDNGAPAGHAAVGRAALALNQFADAIVSLATAAERGDPDAPFFLGLAHTQLDEMHDAVTAFMSTGQESIYYPFALALALNHVEQGVAGADPVSLQQRIHVALAQSTSISVVLAPALRSTLPWIPEALGFGGPDSGPIFGNMVPVIVRWRDKAPAHDLLQVLAVTLTSPSAIFIRNGNMIYQLQWAVNALPFGSFEQASLGSRSPAGFVDFGHETSAVATAEVASARSREGQALQVTCTAADTPSDSECLVYSIPVDLRPGTFYIVSGRVYAPQTQALFGWESLNDTETVVTGANAVDGVAVPSWSWHAVVAQTEFPSIWLRAVAGVYQAAGTAMFDDVVLLQLITPEAAP